jgi:hypothetical protein
MEMLRQAQHDISDTNYFVAVDFSDVMLSLSKHLS